MALNPISLVFAKAGGESRPWLSWIAVVAWNEGTVVTIARGGRRPAGDLHFSLPSEASNIRRIDTFGKGVAAIFARF
jgi:hypothetical protein